MSASLRRLKTRPEFLRVAAAQRKWITPGMIVQARRRRAATEDPAARACGDEAGDVRFGLTVSRKVGKAVTRNRARRRLRAVAEEVLPRAGRPDTDYVLIGRKGTIKRPFQLLVRDLEWALTKLERRQLRRSQSA